MNESSSRWTPIVLCLFLAGIAARGQNPDAPNVYLSVSVDAKQKMQLLDGYIEQKNWAEAVDLLQSLAEKQGDRLAPTTAENPSLFVNVRAFCNARIAALPAEALAVYRSRVDGQAENLWRQWTANRDVAALRKLADEMLCSTAADYAVDRLGDHSFANGRLSEAIGWWKRLLPAEWFPTPSGRSIQTRCPTPRTDPARIAAKCVMAAALSSDLSEARRLLEALRAKHPNAKGKLAGEDRGYVQFLEMLLKSDRLALPPSTADYATFAGDERRNKAAPNKLDVGGLQYLWDFDVDPNPERDDSPINDLRLPHFPVVIGDEMYAATDAAVWKFDLKSGKSARWLDFGANRNGSDLQRAKYTLTIKGRKLLVAVHDQRGSSERRPRQFGPRRDWHNVGSTLLCFDVVTKEKLWTATPQDYGADRGAVFEGSPIAVGDDFCIAVTRYDAMSETSIYRLDGDTHSLVWKSVVCESMTEGAGADPPLYNLLAADDSTIYYCTNLGAVAAVRAEDGRVQWASTYTRRGPATTAPGDPSIPDLNPCVVHEGKVFALPRDGRRLLCYDAQTGEKLWESPASLPFSHILGAHDGLVVASGSRVCAFDTSNGKLRWMRPANSTPGFGRGVIAGGSVYWPTRTDVHVYDVQTGALARPAIELFTRMGHRPGNLLPAGDYLVIAQGHRLLAFSSISKLIERRRREIVENPISAEPHFKLADALFQHGDFHEAAEAFGAAAKLAGPLRIVDGKKMFDDAVDRRFQALLAFAQQQPKASTSAAFAKALEAARTPEQRVDALRKEFVAAEPKRQASICQAILDSAALRGAVAPIEGVVGETGRLWASRELDALVNRHGKSIYADQEKAFNDELARAEQSTERLIELAQRHPLAYTSSKAVLARAEVAAKTGDFATARRLCKEVVTAYGGTAEKGAAERALSLLVEANRRLGHLEAGYLWAAHLARSSDRSWPANPGVRRVEFDWRPGADPTKSEIAPAGAEFAAIDVAHDKDASIVRWSESGSKPRLETSVHGRIAWAGLVAGRLLVAAGDELFAFTAAAPNKPDWRFPFRQSPRFRSTLEEPSRRPAISAASDRFLIAGDRAVVSGDRHAFAVDVETGQTVWRVPAPRSERPASLSLVDATLFLHSDEGSAALDPVSGRTLFATPTPALSTAACKEVIASAVDRSTIIARDQKTGGERWRHPLSIPTTSEPKLFADAESVYVLYDGVQAIALDPAKGEVRWRVSLGERRPWSSAAVAGGDAICLASGDELICFEAKNGDRRWRRRFEGALEPTAGRTVLAIDDDVVVYSRWADRWEKRLSLPTGEVVGGD